MTALAEAGLTIELPKGWDGQIRTAGQSAASAVRTANDGPRPIEGVVLHAASFPLPPERGDYGSGAVEVMGGSDVLLCLLEHEQEATQTALFARKGMPRLDPATFSPQSMQRAIPGMAGSQHFFQVAGRAFCLYVVVGSWHTRRPLVRAADRVATSIRIDP